MIEVRQTARFRDWLDQLADRQGRARILSRLDRFALGNLGDVKSVGEGVSELRIDTGPGYRIYFMPRGKAVVLLLIGGDKKSQARDIATAKAMAQQLKG